MTFERVKTPEEVGVSSKVLCDYFDMLDGLKVENRAFILIKDDKLVAENYVAPFTESDVHSEFSVSKGFISTAVGYAIDEGKMTLDTPILDYFPEFEEYKKKDARNGQITVHELLTMTSGKKCNFVKDMTKGDYSVDWVKYKFRKDKGFMYSNDDVYMLAKAITKIYGCTVIDMLMPRLFEPLGIKRPFWETTTQGIEAGATGLRLRPFDLAKVAYCYLNGGKYDGKQVIPQNWTEIAGQYYVPLPEYYGKDCMYGYFFWGDPNGGYRFDGMYGQWAWIFPKHNAVLIMNDSTCDCEEVIENTFTFFPRAFDEKPSDDAEAYQRRLEKRFESNALLPRTSDKRSSVEKDVDGLVYSFKKYSHADFVGYPISMLPMMASGTYPQKAKRSFDGISLRFKETSAFMSWREGEEECRVEIGLDGNYKESHIILGTFPFKVLSRGEWLDDNTLQVELRYVETPVSRWLKFKFSKDKLKLSIWGNPTIAQFALGYMGEVMSEPKGIVRALLKVAFKIMTPTLKSRGKRI